MTPKYTYLLRTADSARRGYGGFQYPESGPVEASDWSPEPKCGNGLHGLLMGTGDQRLLSYDEGATWQILRVLASEVVDLGDKVKVPRADVVYSGSPAGALALLADLGADLAALPRGRATASGYEGQATASGYRGQATASGYRGQATASGYRGQATASGDEGRATASGEWGRATASGYEGQATASGEWGRATASGYEGQATASGEWGRATASGEWGRATASGYEGQATASGEWGRATASGEWGRATASGYEGQATASGYRGQATASGYRGQAHGRYCARAGEMGLVMVHWWNYEANRERVTVGYVGEDGIEPMTWYRADHDGKLVPMEDA